MNEVIVSMNNISKSFPGVKALDHVKFELRSGEVMALLGENGAGKSTLMKILSGVYTRDEGTMEIFGKSYDDLTPKQAQEAGVAIIHQELNMCRHLTVTENMFLGREVKGGLSLNNAKMRKEAKKVLDDLRIDISPDQIVGDLPVSKQQMVEIAKALSINARILIMDEPTAPLTVDEVKLLFKIIRDLKAQGVTIIYISHRLEELFEIGDRISVMRDGKYVCTMDVKDATQQKLIAAMVGREVSQTCPARSNVIIGEELLRLEHVCGNGDTDINFTLHKGEVLGFGGLVGAGRTELMEVIYGAQPLESGQIYYKGQPVKIDSPRKGIKTGIGLVPEDRKGKGLFLDKGVAWNSTINCLDRFANGTFGLVRTKEVEKEAEKYQKAFNIKTPSLNQLVMNLSGGNQQKVVLAKTMAADAEVIIFDEPTRGIDVGAKQEIYNLMNELAAQGKGILMVSSDMPELLGMCDRIVVISEGRQTGIVDKEDFSQETILSMASISAVKDA